MPGNVPLTTAHRSSSPRAAKGTRVRTSRSRGANASALLDVLAVSDLCVDVILTGNVRPQFHQVEQIIGDCSIELGGSANIFASQLAKLGARTGLLGWHGQDVFGEFALQQLQASGVDVNWVRPHPLLKTGIGFALSEPDDRAILTYMGTIDATQPEHLEWSLLPSCRHWHIAAYFLLMSLQSSWLPWLKKCRELGITTSLDPNWDPLNRWDGIAELLPYVDVFLPNEQEAVAITSAPEVATAARALAKSGTLVVVKRGEKGVFAMHGERSWEFDAAASDVQPKSIVDATGAGDNFDAGFIRAWLAGWNVDECIDLGHRCAVSSLAAPGGVRGQLRREQVPDMFEVAKQATAIRERNK